MHFRAAGNLVFEVAALYAESASKNKELGHLFATTLADICAVWRDYAKYMEKKESAELFDACCQL